MRQSITLPGLILFAAIFAGCAGPPRERAEITAVESRIDAVPGYKLVVPVELSGPLDPSAPIEARLDDGRRPDAALFWISVGPEEAADPHGWLAPAGTWYATPASASSRPSAAGVWAVVLDLPSDAAGQGIWLQSKRLSVNWISDSPSSSAIPAPSFAISETANSPWLSQMLEPERNSPPRRWRARLISGELGAAPDAPFPDPVLEALAIQAEARWAAGLRRLERESPALAGELEWRLAEVLDFAGTRAPVWPTDERELESLLADLLSPGLAPARRAERVRVWLDALPRAVAWVADDAGRRDAGAGVSIATIGIANLLPTGVLAGLVPDDGSLPSDLIPLGGSSAVMPSIPLTPAKDRFGEPEHDPAPVRVRARAGGWESACEVLAAPAPARPPGLRVGPLLNDWTMASWMGASPVPESGERAAILLLMKESGNAGWTLYLESRRDPEARAEDTVRIWLGPLGSPAAILRVSSDGLILDEAGAGARTRDPARTPVARAADGRWICRLAIPPTAIEADGTLRIGVERTNAGGQRSAWPRPMLPWQAEPGRVAVDTTTWGDLGVDSAGR